MKVAYHQAQANATVGSATAACSQQLRRGQDFKRKTETLRDFRPGKVGTLLRTPCISLLGIRAAI